MEKPDFSNLKALFVNGTLKKSPRQSHTRGLIDVSMNIMKKEGWMQNVFDLWIMTLHQEFIPT